MADRRMKPASVKEHDPRPNANRPRDHAFTPVNAGESSRADNASRNVVPKRDREPHAQSSPRSANTASSPKLFDRSEKGSDLPLSNPKDAAAVTRDPRRLAVQSARSINIESAESAGPSLDTTLHNSLKEMIVEIVGRSLERKDLAALDSQIRELEAERNTARKRFPNHLVLANQLDDKIQKLKMKFNTRKNKLEGAKAVVGASVNKAVGEIMRTIRDSTDKSADSKASLQRRELEQEGEIDRLKTEVRNLKSQYEQREQGSARAIRELRDQVKQAMDSQAQSEKQILVSQQLTSDLAELRQQQNRTDKTTADRIQPLQHTVDEHKLALANLSNIFTTQKESKVLSERVEEVSSRKYLQESEFMLYVNKFNSFEEWTRGQFKNVTTHPIDTTSFVKIDEVAKIRKEISDQRLERASADASLDINKRVLADTAPVKRELGSLTLRIAKMENENRDLHNIVARASHSITSLNARYNNLTSEQLATSMLKTLDTIGAANRANMTKITSELGELQGRVRQRFDQQSSEIQAVETKMASQAEDYKTKTEHLGTRQDSQSTELRTLAIALQDVLKTQSENQKTLSTRLDGVEKDIPQNVALFHTKFSEHEGRMTELVIETGKDRSRIESRLDELESIEMEDKLAALEVLVTQPSSLRAPSQASPVSIKSAFQAPAMKSAQHDINTTSDRNTAHRPAKKVKVSHSAVLKHESSATAGLLNDSHAVVNAGTANQGVSSSSTRGQSDIGKSGEAAKDAIISLCSDDEDEGFDISKWNPRASTKDGTVRPHTHGRTGPASMKRAAGSSTTKAVKGIKRKRLTTRVKGTAAKADSDGDVPSSNASKAP